MNLTHEYLAVDNAERIVEAWESYKQFTVRPVVSTEKYYESLIDRKKDSLTRALVYGGTPEIRSPLQKQKINTILLDRSRAMVEALGRLSCSGLSIAPNESIIESDWRNLPVESNSVDIAFGDDAVNMLDWDQFPAFLREARRVLVPGGWFACHLLVQPLEIYRKQSVREIVELYRENKITSVFDYASRINFSFYNDSTFRMGWQVSIAGLRKALKEGLINDDFGFINRFENCNSSFTCPPLDLWEAEVRNYFEIDEIFYPEEYDYCRFEPLYLLRKPL